MTIQSLLEDFGPATLVAKSPDTQEIAQEEIRLAAFEQGYGAGWEDALAAQKDLDEKATQALLRSIEDASFPYHEALAQLTRSAVPVFEAMLKQVIPRAIEASILPILTEEISQLLSTGNAPPLQVTASPARIQMLQAKLPADLSVSVVGDPSLGRDELYFKLADAERRIDLSDTASRLEAAIAALSHHSSEDRLHG